MYSNIMAEQVRAEYNAQKRSVGVMYLLWFFLGTFGAHKLYVKDYTAGFLQLFLFYMGIALASSGWGFMLIMVWGIWMLINLFTNSAAVQKYNWNLHRDIIKEHEMRYEEKAKGV